MQPLITIVIPLYNSEKYFSECIKSVIKQSYTNLEVIIIDDGSTDKSGIIADNYAHNDSRLKVFHKQNEGVSATRNFGIKKSNGDYICFVDSDDTIDEFFVEKLYKCIEKYNCEIVICEMQFIKLLNNQYTVLGGTNFNNQLVNIDKSYSFDRNVQHLCACAALYSKKIMSNIEFDKTLYIGEDALFHNQVLLQSKSVYYLSEKLYKYIMHEDSAFKSSYTKKRFTEVISWQKICDLYSDYPTAFKSSKAEYCIRCISVYKEIIKTNNNDYNHDRHTLITEIKNSRNYLKFIDLSIREKTYIYLAAYCPFIFSVIYKFYYNFKRVSTNND